MAVLDLEHLAWLVCDGRTIFLDVSQDRYFRLTPERDQDFQSRCASQGSGAWRQPDDLPRPAGWVSPRSAFDAASDQQFSLSGVAAAIWIQRRTEHRLARRGLHEVLLDIKHVRPDSPPPASDCRKIRSVLLAFEQAKLLRTAADRCLPRSIALVAKLASRGIRAELVIGVRDEPFGAHSWAQLAGVVLNETLEEARRYAPILVI